MDWTQYYSSTKKFGNQEKIANEEMKNIWAERRVKDSTWEMSLLIVSIEYLLSELAKSWAKREGWKGVTD